MCSHAYQAQSVQAIFMLGLTIGSLIFGNLADRFGRHPFLWSCLIGMFLFSLCGSFATIYTLYCALRLYTGIFCGGYGVICFVLITELVGKNERSFCGTIFPVIFACGIVIYSGMAYLIRDWRTLSLVSSLPGLIGFFFRW